MKSIFSRHGIPEVLLTDNGPQYDSKEFTEPASHYGFSHSTSSPHFPQSNGFAERAIKMTKGCLKKSKDPYLAILSHRAIPLPWCNFSPAELLMGRQIPSTILQTTGRLTPQWQFLTKFRELNRRHKWKQKEYFNSQHWTKSFARHSRSHQGLDNHRWKTVTRENNCSFLLS